ncbi:MAG: hypothetical protein K8R23_01175 [Chthoniobacter sp.]|nr:hypothetical protein [Chthoniobacter sp.]
MACFTAFILLRHISLDDHPTDFTPRVVPATSDSRLNLISFPITPSYAIAIHDWSISVGSYSFGIIDCATQFIGNQPSERITLVKFGTWEAFCNFHAEYFAIAVAASIAALFAFTCVRHFSSHHEQEPKIRNA